MPRQLVVLRGIILAVIVLASSAASAQNEQIYVVEDVQVDVTADNSVVAREQALGRAPMEAFEILVQQRWPAGTWERLGRLDPSTVGGLVRGLAIKSERKSAVRYRANLSVRFDGPGVRLLLGPDQVAGGGTQRLQAPDVAGTIDPAPREGLSGPGPTILILPIYTEAGQPALWEADNLWRDIWATDPVAGTPPPVVVPIGDVLDIGDIDAGRAFAGDVTGLPRMLDRYAADQAVVAHASLVMETGAVQPSLDVRGIAVGGSGSRVFFEQRYSGASEGARREIMLQAIKDLHAAMTGSALDELPSGGGNLTVTVPLSGFNTWQEVRRRLGQVRLVQGTRLISLQLTNAIIEIGFRGSLDQLTAEMAASGLRLKQESNGWKVILQG